MGELKHICEVTYAQLDELVKVVNQYWDTFSKRPMIKEEVKNQSYWEEIHRKGRLIVYKADNNEVGAIMALLKVDKNVTIDVFIIAPPYMELGIEPKMLRVAERIAVHWSAEQLSWLFSGKEDIEKEFPIFQQLGYVLHCPMNKKGFMLLEKKVV